MADVITRLKLDSGEYDSKIKRAVSALQQMEAECRKVGGTLAVLEKDQLEYVQAIGKMETVSKSARGKIGELSSAFTELSIQYKHLTDEEKSGDFGKALTSSLDQLKVRINDAKIELADVEKELKGAGDSAIDWSSALGQLGGQLGINSQLMGVLTSGTIATTAAVTAGAAAVAAATKMWADYNDEMNRQTSMTKVVTGLDGSEAEGMVVSVRALAKTYDVDFRQAIDTANTLMHQFGLSGEKSIQLLRDGMQGMIAGDGPKLLSMIQQFAPAFVDAGISADKLVAIIHNSEGGLFSEQNMNAILMGIKNIRLMTKATSDALAQMGIDGEEMSKKMSDGSMTVFEALQQVAEALEKANAGSREAGQVMQSVFGRQGAMQGMKLARAIAELNTNLEETKTQTGELGQSFVKLNQANEQLENTMKEVFGVSGWEDMSNMLKTDLANTLNDIIGFLGDIKSSIRDIGTEKGFDSMVNVLDSLVIPKLFGAVDALKGIRGLLADIAGWNNNTSMGDYFSNIRSKFEDLKKEMGDGLKVEVKEVDGKVVSAHKWVRGKKVDVTEQYIKEQAERDKQAQPTTPLPPKTTNTSSTKKVTTQQTEEQKNNALIADLTKEYQQLATAAKTADDAQKAGLTERMNAIKTEIGGLQKRNEELKKFADEATGNLKIDIEYPEGSLPKLEKQLADLQKAQKQALDNYEWTAYQQAIDEATKKIGILKGELPKGMQATYTLKVNKEQLDALRRDGLFSEKDVRVNVEPGDVDIPAIPSDEIIRVNVEPGDVDIPAIPSDETIRVNVETGDVDIPAIPSDETVKVNVETGKVDLKPIPTELTQKVDVEHGNVNLPDIPKEIEQIVNTHQGEMMTAEIAKEITQTINTRLGRIVTPDILESITQTINTKIGRVVTPTIAKELTQEVNVKTGKVDLKPIPADETIKVNVETGGETASTLEQLATIGGDESVKVGVELAGDSLSTVESLHELDNQEYVLTIAADTVAAVDKVGELVKDIEHQQPVIEPKVEMPQNLETLKQSIEAALNMSNVKADTTTFTTLLRTAVKNGISDLDGDFSELFAKMGIGLDIPDDTWQMLQDEINTRLQELGIDPIKIDFETGNVKNVEKDAKGIDKSFNAAASAVQNVGNALSNLEDPGAKVAGIIAEAVANIALGFATATSKSAGGGVFKWIAAIAGGLATMTSTIAAIHNVTGYATGGVVEGPSGVDKVPAMLTAGEVVLNHAQQNALASELEGGGIQNLSLETRISAEDIRLVLNNRGRRTGKGEYIQTNFR